MTEYIVWKDDIGEGLERIVYRGELIRCKDCKYKQHMQIRYGEQMWEVDYCVHERMRETSISASSVEADDFCSWAERKEE